MFQSPKRPTLLVVAALVGAACVSAQPAGSPSISALDDEFSSGPALSPNWFVNHVEENMAPRHTRMDIATGRLVIVPDPVAIPGGVNAGWYENYDGPYVYKLVEGDFSVMTHVTALDVRNPAIAPSGAFLSAGMIARDPASAATVSGPAPGTENWIMYNLGSQGNELANGLGTEGKVTVNAESLLTLTPIGCNSGRLIMCRQGQVVRLLRNLDCDAEGVWTEQHVYDRDTTVVDGQGPTPFPSTLQLGLIANGWGGNPHLQAEYEYIRFRQPDPTAATPQDACTSPFATPAPPAVVAPGVLLQEHGSAVTFGLDNLVRLYREGNALAVSSDVLLAGSSLQATLLAIQQDIQELRTLVESTP